MATLYKMEVPLRQMVRQDAIWLVMVIALKLAEVVIDWIYTLTVEVLAVLGMAPQHLGPHHQMESTRYLPILHRSRDQAVRL